MRVARLPVNEQERLKSLNEFYLLESIAESDFDNFTQLATSILGGGVVCGLIDIDRHWSKFPKTTPEDVLHHLLFRPGSRNETSIIIPDISKEISCSDDAEVILDSSVKFYAQFPLLADDNQAIGALSIIGTDPMQPTEQQVTALQLLSKQIVRQLNLVKKIDDLKQVQLEQKSAYADLEKFSFVASHDLRSPLNNIISLTQILKEDFSDQLNEEGRDYINFLNNAANQLADLVSGILEYSRSSQILVDKKEKVEFGSLIDEIKRLLHVHDRITISYEPADGVIFVSKIAIKQILLNLCDNAIKHNDEEEGWINISLEEGPRSYTFKVADNGPGIPKQDQKRIFELFERINNHPSRAIEGIGIGLSIVKRLVEKSGGEIKVYSEPGAGTTFQFTIQK